MAIEAGSKPARETYASGNRNQGSIQAQHPAAVQVARRWSKRKTLVVIIAICGAFWAFVAIIVTLAF